VHALHALHASRSSHEKAIRPSICLPNAWIVTKQKKVLPRFLYHIKDNLSWFSEKYVWWGRPLIPEIMGQTDCVGAKTPIFSRYSLVAPQP